MEDYNLNIVKNKLKKYNQEHLLEFYNDLSDSQKENLLNQILKIDFEQIFKLYENSKINSPTSSNNISPLTHINKKNLSEDDLNLYETLGTNAIKNGELAVITLAGGQGTRLGHNGPKGTFEIDLAYKKKSLFEILNDGLKKANNLYQITIPWYIMTSETNDTATKKFFEENNYFGYPKEYVHFFIQDKLPILDTSGKLLLAELYLVLEASNGNGNVYESMAKYGIIEELKRNNIKWVFIGGIDNILLKMVDPIFLGATIASNMQIASKTIFKENPLEKECVFCKINNKPSILDYNDITLELSEQKDENGTYLYRELNMLSHLYSIDAIEKISKCTLPYHRAFKKNTFINSEGMKQIPNERNSFKFETFVFDAFNYFDDMLLFRVEKDEEFAPIKNSIGLNSPETATKLYLGNLNK